MGPFLRPLHLLLLGIAPADDEIDGGFGKLCRCWRTVSGLVVSATGRTSLSKAVVMPKEISEAQRLSRYSSSGAVCSVNSSASGLKVWLSAGWHRQR
jgi:hypothetical protein